jgi:hypothetical protein
MQEGRRRWWSLLVAVGLLMALLPVSGALANHEPPDDQVAHSDVVNQTPYWENIYLPTKRGITGASCTKINEVGNTAFVMPAEPVDRDWVLLAVKQSQTNFVYYDPIAGHSYPSLGQQAPGFSHLIVCSVEEPVFVPDPELAVTKTAEASYDLSHAWDIAKAADLTTVNLTTDGLGDSLVTWTVDVTYEGETISNGTVTGTITIDNTGNVGARVDSVADVLDTGEIGVVDCGVTFPVVLDAFTGQLNCTYEVGTGDSIDATLNTATASGEFAIDEAGTFDGSDTFIEEGTAAVTFVLDSETDATVNINDLSDLFGSVDLGTATAPNDAQFQYSKSFAYADFETCGAHTFNNTATIVETGQEADESVVVNVQCLIFQGESATGDGLPWSGVDRKVKNWFEFSPFAETEGDIVSGRNLTDIGDFTYTNIDGPSSELCFDLDDPWVFADASGNVKVQPLNSAPSKYLSPGQFAHHFTLSGDGCVTVPDASYGYAIHLDVGQFVADPGFSLLTLGGSGPA